MQQGYLKGTFSVNLSVPPCKDGNVRFLMVLLNFNLIKNVEDTIVVLFFY